jgi:gamma-glutamyltranspeptidase / glutathione hydrolase
MTGRDFHLPGRSPVYAGNAMCATSHPLASEAAIAVLRGGGNAVDAAVTAAAVLSVVEPAMTGIGGDCFVLIARKGKAPFGLNGSGRAPATATPQWYQLHGIEEIDRESVHAVTVPGAVDAWDRLLAREGTIGLDEALAPAIRLAEDGFFVAPRVAFDWGRNGESLARDPGTRAIYLKDGRPYELGDRVRLPVLAKTLKTLAKHGREAFYEGPIAEALVRNLNALGGLHTREDFAATESSWVEPVIGPYRGIDAVEMPPNTQGITVHLLLNILENFDLSALDPLGPERLHLEVEAVRSAYRFRNQMIADPEAMRVDVSDFVDKRLGRDLAAHIDPNRRNPDFGPARIGAGSDTVYLTVVDTDRTAVSFINSLFRDFGSRICDPATGVLYHSRGSSFTLDPEHPNCIGPRKRPMHTLIPAMTMRDGRVELSYGVMGAAYQPVGHVHVVTNVYDYGMDIQQAIDLPRLFLEEGRLGVERGIPEAARAALAAKGHDVFVIEKPWGGGQGIMIDWERGLLIGGSDPRKDGCALGF